MKILVLSDIHGCIDYFDLLRAEITSCDLVLISGDITNFGNYIQAKGVFDSISRYNNQILAVPGNCDRSGVDEYLKESSFGINCGCTCINGIQFAGIGGSLPCPHHTPNESVEEEFEVCLNHIGTMITQSNPLVLLTHQPANGTNLDFAGGRHNGSYSIRNFIEQYKPILAISGHIHEKPGTDKINQTTVLNPGPIRNGKYAVIQINKLIEKIELKQV